MRVQGIPKDGKRITFYGAFTLELPYGAIYYKNAEGGYAIALLQEIPANYKDGSFYLPDESETKWQFNNLHCLNNFTSTGGTKDEFVSSMKEAGQGALAEITNKLASTDGFAKDNPLLAQLQSSLNGLMQSVNDLMQSVNDSDSEEFLVPDMGFHDTKDEVFANTNSLWAGYTYAINNSLGTVNSNVIIIPIMYPNASIYMGMLSYCPPDDFTKEFLTILKSISVIETATESRTLTPQEVLDSLDFTKGERIDVGEFSVLVPTGMTSSQLENSETRLLTCIPSGISFDAQDWFEQSAIVFTWQTGQAFGNMGRIDGLMDSAKAEKFITDFFENANFSVGNSDIEAVSSNSIIITEKTRDYVVAYCIDEDVIDYIDFIYFVFSNELVYTGRLTGVKEGVGNDCKKFYADVLVTWLKTISLSENAETKAEQLRAIGKQQYGQLAEDNGKIDAVYDDDDDYNDDEYVDNDYRQTYQITAKAKYTDISLSTDNIEYSDQIEKINVGDALSIEVKQGEYGYYGYMVCFAAKEGVIGLLLDYQSEMLQLLHSGVNKDKFKATVSSVLPVSQRRKGAKYGFVCVDIVVDKSIVGKTFEVEPFDFRNTYSDEPEGGEFDDE
jgi:hypothetical protein